MKQTTMVAAFFAVIFSTVGGAAAHSFRSQELKVHNVANDKELAGSLSLLQVHLPEVNASADLTEGIQAFPDLATIETTLAEMTAEKKAGKATPGMDTFAETVTKMIKEEMIPAIKKGHKDAKTTLANFKAGFRRCNQIRTVANGAIKTMKTNKGSLSTSHKACRKVESRKYYIKEACKKVVEAKRKAKVAACGAFRALHRNPYSEANKCHPTGKVAYGTWLTGNRKFFQERYKEFKAAKELCRQTTLAWRTAWIACNKKIKAWSVRRAGCIKKQRRLETITCTLGKKMKGTCDQYDTCYDAQVTLYKKQKPKLMLQEKDRKGEFRALKRIDCLLSALAGGASDDEIDKCKGKTHGTKWLNLVYPKIPTPIKCPILPPIPGEKMFKLIEFRGLPSAPSAPMLRVQRCIISPAAGILLGVEKSQKKQGKCGVRNGWLTAKDGGSCLISQRNGIPVQVNYMKAKYTKFRFIMKMEEESTRNAYKGGGGFSLCNNNAFGWRSSSPAIQFVDAKKPSQWGYKLTPSWASNPIRSRTPVTCKQLMTKMKVWGKEANGIELSKFTNSKMKWMGCMGDGCKPKDFVCTQKRDEIVFGAKGTMRVVLGNKVPAAPKGKPACGSKSKLEGMFNPMDKTKDIDRLCKMMGYTRGSILSRKKQNFCPGVGSTKTGWGSSFKPGTRYGSMFRCQGPMAAGLYSSKKYYGGAEPSVGKSVQWSVTMMYSRGKYSLKSLKIGGKSFDGLAGKMTKCTLRGPYPMAPRVVSHGSRGQVYIKDFRVFQGSSMQTKKMKQVVGNGLMMTSDKELRAKLRRALRKAYQTYEVFRMATVNIKQPTWFQMYNEARKRGGRLMTYSEAKLFINKRKGAVIFKNQDSWAAVTNPREKNAKSSSWGKKDWIQLGSKPHPPKTSHSAKFKYPVWGDNPKSHRGGAATSVLLYVTKSKRKYVTQRVKITQIVRQGGKRIKKIKTVLRKIVKPRPAPKPRKVCNKVKTRRYRNQRYTVTRCKKILWRRHCWRQVRTRRVPYDVFVTKCKMVRR